MPPVRLESLKTPTVPQPRIIYDTEPELVILRVERSKDPPLEIIPEMRGGASEFTRLPVRPRSLPFCLFLMTSDQYDGAL